MDVKHYFEKANKKLDEMSDKEFLNLLKKAGIGECSLRDDIKGEYKVNEDGTKILYSLKNENKKINSNYKQYHGSSISKVA